MAANKPTAVHYFLVFFVMLAIILGVTTYIFLDESRTADARYAAAEKEKGVQKSASFKNAEDVAQLKGIIGHAHPEVGTAGDKAGNSVASAVAADLEKTAGGQMSISDGLADLRRRLDAKTAEHAALQAEKVALDQQIQVVDTQSKAEAAQYRTERDTAVQQKTSLVTEHAGKIGQLQTRINEADATIQKLQLDIQQAEQSHKQEVAKLTDNISRLKSINDRLRDQMQAIQNVSFERSDGEITWVDNNARLVWVNLGSADKLSTRTSFSIYSRINRGVGRASEDKARGPEDIKGSIEITRIVGPHSAEGRIIEEDIYTPITAGDLVYTPIWSPNQTEKFAFVGIMDLDGDGKSDRDVLHDMVTSVGSTIQVEIDDNGIRQGTDIDETTKFLVVGEIPDLAKATKQEDKDRITEMVKQHKALKEAAREQGVRYMSLNDFLALMGYTPKQRVFRPGDKRPWNLRAGAASATSGEDLGGNRQSSGQTAFGKRNRLKAPTEPSRNSTIYGGN